MKCVVCEDRMGQCCCNNKWSKDRLARMESYDLCDLLRDCHTGSLKEEKPLRIAILSILLEREIIQ